MPTSLTSGQLAERAIDLMFVQRDFAAMREHVWTDGTVDTLVALGLEVRGREALSEFFGGFFAAVPDARLTLDRTIEADRTAIVEWTMTGTFDGEPWQGLEPTGKAFTFRGVDVFTWDDDGFLETANIYYDGAEFARQIGMLPPRDSFADRAMTAGFNATTRLRRRLKRA